MLLDRVSDNQMVSKVDGKSKLYDVFHFDFVGKENSNQKLAAQDAMKIWQASEKNLKILEKLFLVSFFGAGGFCFIYLSYLYFSDFNFSHIREVLGCIICYVCFIGPIILLPSTFSFLGASFILEFVYKLFIFFRSSFRKAIEVDEKYYPVNLKDFLNEESFNLYYAIYIEGQFVKMEPYGIITNGFSVGKHNPLIKDNGEYFSIGDFDQDLSDGFFYRKLKLKKCNSNKGFAASSCVCDNKFSHAKGSEISYKEARKIIDSSGWPTNLSKDLILTQKLYIKRES